MKLDIETARCYSALGDIVMLAWLAEGAKAAGAPLEFHRKRDLVLMEMLGLAVDPEPGGTSLDPAYATEVNDRGARPRLDYIREFLGTATPLARPSWFRGHANFGAHGADAVEYSCAYAGGRVFDVESRLHRLSFSTAV